MSNAQIEVIHTSYIRKLNTIVVRYGNMYYTNTFKLKDFDMKMVAIDDFNEVFRNSINKKSFRDIRCLYDVEKDSDCYIHKKVLKFKITLIRYNIKPVDNKLFESEHKKIVFIEDDLYGYRQNYYDVYNINLLNSNYRKYAEKEFDTLANNAYLRDISKKYYIEFIRFNTPTNFDIVIDPMKKSNNVCIKIYSGKNCKSELVNDNMKAINYDYLLDHGDVIIVKSTC